MAFATAIGAAVVIGLVNGILIGGLKLNALIVTLAVGQVAIGVVNRYGSTFPVQSPVPTGLSDWTSTRILGVSPILWVGVGLHHPPRRCPQVHGGRSKVPGGRGQPGGLPRRRCPGESVSSLRLRGGSGPLRHRRSGAGRAPPQPGSQHRHAVSPGPDRGGRHRWCLADRRSRQPGVHFCRRLFPHRPQPDDASDGAAHRTPVRGLRSGHHRGHAGFGRSDHQRRGAVAPRTEGSSRRHET